MVFSRGSTSFDKLPATLQRSRCVENYAPLKQAGSIPPSSWEGYDDIDDNEIISVAKMSQTPAWTQRGVPIAPKHARPILATSTSIVEQLKRQMAAAPKKQKPAAAKKSRARRPKLTESEEEQERTAENVSWREARSEEDEPNTDDEEAIVDDDEEVEELSDVSSDETGDESESNYSEDEAEFSDESDEELVEVLDEEDDGEEDDIDSDQEDRSVRRPMTAKETEIMAVTVAAQQIMRRLTPLMVGADSHLRNIMVCMFWAHYMPEQHGVMTIDEAMPMARDLIEKNKMLASADTTVGACYVWRLNFIKLHRTLCASYKNTPFIEWLTALEDERVAGKPVHLYPRAKSHTCFFTKVPCNRGVQLVDCDKKPLSTLWFDATNYALNVWVVQMVRFFFLPETVRELCDVQLKELPGDQALIATRTWIEKRAAEAAPFLQDEGVCSNCTALLDRELTWSYKK